MFDICFWDIKDLKNNKILVDFEINKDGKIFEKFMALDVFDAIKRK